MIKTAILPVMNNFLNRLFTVLPFCNDMPGHCPQRGHRMPTARALKQTSCFSPTFKLFPSGVQLVCRLLPTCIFLKAHSGCGVSPHYPPIRIFQTAVTDQ